LLAVGFHQLIEQLVQADVPVLFLAFPRFTSDPDYLYRKLAPLLPIDIDITRARKVHATTFKAEKVRVERELSDHGEVTPVRGGLEYPTLRALDNAALKREVNHLRNRASEAQEQCAKLEEQLGIVRSKVEQAAAEVRCATLASERDALRDQLQRQRDENALLAQEVLALRASKSWRLTLPLRMLTSAFRSRALGRK
jgi:hypothetical protein